MIAAAIGEADVDDSTLSMPAAGCRGRVTVLSALLPFGSIQPLGTKSLSGTPIMISGENPQYSEWKDSRSLCDTLVTNLQRRSPDMAKTIAKMATTPDRRRKAKRSTAEHDSPCPAPATVVGGEWNFTSFEEWVGGCEDKAFRLAMHFLRNEPAVQEILRETFLAAWENIQAFTNRTRFNAWVYRTTVKSALERLSSERSQGQLSQDRTLLFLFTTREFWSRLTADEDPNWSMRPPQQLGSDDLLRYVRKSVDSLPLELRAVFVVCGVEEMSLEEGADILDLPVMTVRAQLQAATLAVRHAIGRYFALSVGRISRGVALDASVSVATN